MLFGFIIHAQVRPPSAANAVFVEGGLCMDFAIYVATLAIERRWQEIGMTQITELNSSAVIRTYELHEKCIYNILIYRGENDWLDNRLD